MVKRLSTMRETWVWSLDWEDPLEKEMAVHSSTITWKIPWTEEPPGLQSMGVAKSQTRLSDFTFTRPFRSNTPKRCPFHYRGLEWKVGSQETPGVTGKFGLGMWNEAGQRLIEFCQENALVIANTLFQQHKRRLYIWTSPEIRLVIFFAAKDGEALYSQQTQDQELTVAQIMNSLLPNWDWNWRK